GNEVGLALVERGGGFTHELDGKLGAELVAALALRRERLLLHRGFGFSDGFERLVDRLLFALCECIGSLPRLVSVFVIAKLLPCPITLGCSFNGSSSCVREALLLFGELRFGA